MLVYQRVNAKSNDQQLVYYWDNTCCICIRSPALVYAVAIRAVVISAAI
jgi:hypothetical protein